MKIYAGTDGYVYFQDAERVVAVAPDAAIALIVPLTEAAMSARYFAQKVAEREERGPDPMRLPVVPYREPVKC